MTWVLLVYLELISLCAAWVWGWCRGHKTGTQDEQRRTIEHREQAWAAYLASKRRQNQPIAFSNSRGIP